MLVRAGSRHAPEHVALPTNVPARARLPVDAFERPVLSHEAARWLQRARATLPDPARTAQPSLVTVRDVLRLGDYLRSCNQADLQAIERRVGSLAAPERCALALLQLAARPDLLHGPNEDMDAWLEWLARAPLEEIRAISRPARYSPQAHLNSCVAGVLIYLRCRREPLFAWVLATTPGLQRAIEAEILRRDGVKPAPPTFLNRLVAPLLRVARVRAVLNAPLHARAAGMGFTSVPLDLASATALARLARRGYDGALTLKTLWGAHALAVTNARVGAEEIALQVLDPATGETSWRSADWLLRRGSRCYVPRLYGGAAPDRPRRLS